MRWCLIEKAAGIFLAVLVLLNQALVVQVKGIHSTYIPLQTINNKTIIVLGKFNNNKERYRKTSLSYNQTITWLPQQSAAWLENLSFRLLKKFMTKYEYEYMLPNWHLLVSVHEGEIWEEINVEARSGVAGRQSPLHTHLCILIYILISSYPHIYPHILISSYIWRFTALGIRP